MVCRYLCGFRTRRERGDPDAAARTLRFAQESEIHRDASAPGLPVHCRCGRCASWSRTGGAPADERQQPAAAASVAASVAASGAARSEWVGQIATIRDETGRNFVLLPASEEIFHEMRACEKAKDDLGISLLVASEKLLLINCGTRAQILDASNADLGCKVRILGGNSSAKKLSRLARISPNFCSTAPAS